MSDDNTTPEGFKMTELGLLPEEWNVVRLKELVDKTEQRDPGKTPEWKFRYIDVSSIERDKIVDARLKIYYGKNAPSRAKKLVKSRDVIFATVRPTLRRWAYIDKKFNGEICSTAFCVLRVKENILDPLYLFYGIARDTFIDELGKVQRGASYPAVTDSDVKNQKIPLPPRPEQKKIAAVLSAVQEAKEKTEAVIQAARELKRSLMKHLFTYGPVSLEDAEHVPLKETEIGLMPEDWRAVKLGDVATLERGKFAFRPRNDPRFYGGNFPFIQTGDVSSSNGWIRTYSQTLNEKGLSVSRLFPKGTLVITIAANIGDVGILAFDSAFPDSLIGITPTSRINNVFLLYYLQTQKEKLNQIAPKSTQKNINLQLLRPYFTSLPPLPVQQKIADTLSSLDHKIEAEENKKKALEALFKTLLSNLMTGKIRVNHLEMAA